MKHAWDKWLFRYLRSWFHLDWDDEYESTSKLLDAKLKRLDQDVGEMLAAELQKFLEEAHSVGAVVVHDWLFVQLTIFYKHPRENYDPIQWLEYIFTRLSESFLTSQKRFGSESSHE